MVQFNSGAHRLLKPRLHRWVRLVVLKEDRVAHYGHTNVVQVLKGESAALSVLDSLTIEEEHHEVITSVFKFGTIEHGTVVASYHVRICVSLENQLLWVAPRDRVGAPSDAEDVAESIVSDLVRHWGEVAVEYEAEDTSVLLKLPLRRQFAIGHELIVLDLHDWRSANRYKRRLRANEAIVLDSVARERELCVCKLTVDHD